MKNAQFKVIKPNDADQKVETNYKIFLAGSIDQGFAEDWQDELIDNLSVAPITVFNPRCDNWNSSMIQDISNAEFRHQVEWELRRLDECDKILMYFDPNGQAPITLLELGLHAHEGKLIVCCPDGFWRKGNVQVVCNTYNIPLYDTKEEFTAAVCEFVGNEKGTENERI